ncbi:hypothetical protein [Bradyrhizobium stylosanthis]|uniref:hypothetical protein n=1 Tax=Bradyrhizobium stylosanthis TaxID=1803665 RepID=UPI000B26DB35|nr:hypothetical protein [Bradyrhizobium stylosanthis]
MSGDDRKPEDRLLALLDSGLAAYRHGRTDDALLLLQEALKTARALEPRQREDRDAG